MKKRLLISLLVLVIAGFIGLVWSFIDYKAVNKSKSYSYEVVQFDYDGASDGVDPNGNPFNPINFLTDDVILVGLNESGLNDKYDVDSVKAYIAIEDIVPSDIVDEINSYSSVVSTTSTTREITTNDYHPIRYRFVLYQELDKKLSQNSLNTLLGNIVKAYCDKFYETYKKSYDTTNYDNMYKMDKYDYVYQVEVLKNKINILNGYARSLYLKHEDFQVNNISFNDISLKCDALINNDLGKIRYIIMLNALSKDLGRLKDYYEYKIEDLGYEKTKYAADLADITAQLNDYTKDSTVYVGSGENIVKVENNSSETYNSLLEKQISTADKIASINTEITDYQSMLDDINNAVSTDDNIVLVESYITKLETDYSDLKNTFDEMVNEYNNKYVIDGSISLGNVKYKSSSIISSSFIVRCIKICAPIVLITAFGLCIYLISFEMKKKKETQLA